MFVIRPVQLADLNHLLELSELTSFGLTTLPKDRNLLEKRINESLRSFRNLDRDSPSGDAFLFVIEDLASRKVRGTCGIISKVGGFEPFYAYRIETSVHDSRMLNVKKEIPVLHLEMTHNGPSEIGSLFLHPDARHGGNGRALSLSRFLFMAEYPKLVDANVLAEMRGVIDDQGRSPFWDALGKFFFDLEFPKADYLSIVNKEFIGDLMPRYPIYIPLLPKEAQAVIGEVHELTRPARRLLETEGFVYKKFVDIFEAGPMLHCPTSQIRSVSESRRGIVTAIHNQVSNETDYLISSLADGFRACCGTLHAMDTGIELDTEAAIALKVSIGDPIRYVTLRDNHTK
ncbi:arginine N-succinyltransferase [Planctomicrobium sp. SH527]|uniref:arginine N-succinyltransferase n=1 Tax=Planctomicrobium sp. SH527 TaxID=3448123 RepID=UPI003F5C53BD